MKRGSSSRALFFFRRIPRRVRRGPIEADPLPGGTRHAHPEIPRRVRRGPIEARSSQRTDGGDPIRWTVDLSGFVLRSSSSSENKMIDVGAVGISRSVRDFQTPVGAFCASTGVAASTSSSTPRKFSRSRHEQLLGGALTLKIRGTWRASPVTIVAPGAS